MRWLQTSALPLVLAAMGCGGDDAPAPAGGVSTTPTVVLVEGAPEAAAPIERVPVAAPTAPTLLSITQGVVAVGTDAGLLVGSSVEPDTLFELAVVADEGGPVETGGVNALARRASGGILVAAEQGLFHDADGLLLHSPLDESLAGMSVAALDAFGEGETEELWLVAGDTLLHVGGGTMEALSIPGASGPVEAAVALGPGRALVVQIGKAYVLDTTAMTATAVAEGLGAVHGVDRADDGTAWIAADAGLLSWSQSGRGELHTFAEHGAPARPVLAVNTAFGATIAVVDGTLVSVEADEARAIDDLGEAAAHGVAVDANGDAWVIDGAKLYRYPTGRPISFESDVRPFFEAHCTSCHDGGKDGAPKFDLSSYVVAKSKAELVLHRLRGVGVAPMPPANVEVLTAADFAVVTRWVGGGTKP